MGKRYIQHSDMCGCERCARVMDLDNSGSASVWDCVEDPDVLDCGCEGWRGCDCYDFDPHDDELEDAHD